MSVRFGRPDGGVVNTALNVGPLLDEIAVDAALEASADLMIDRCEPDGPKIAVRLEMTQRKRRSQAAAQAPVAADDPAI